MTDLVLFFFQAEDGIRDLVRSRGLGDVYKRQRLNGRVAVDPCNGSVTLIHLHQTVAHADGAVAIAVSYTHLTLPTSDLV